MNMKTTIAKNICAQMIKQSMMPLVNGYYLKK